MKAEQRVNMDRLTYEKTPTLMLTEQRENMDLYFDFNL